MKSYINRILALCLLVMSSSMGQERKANSEYDKYAYKNAIDRYDYLVKKGYDTQEIFENLAQANYLNANYVESAYWYEKLFGKYDIETVDPNHYYQYAQSLKSTRRYRESNEWMERFIAKSTDDSRGLKFGANRDYLDKIREKAGSYEVQNVDFNSDASDFAPSFYGERLIFSSNRNKKIAIKKIHQWNNSTFLNIFSAKKTNRYTNNGVPVFDTERFSKDLNSKTHESSTAFTKDGKTIYFTRNNSNNGSFRRDNKGVSRLKIYRAELIENRWVNVKELPFNGENYSTAHPTLNKDESRLYFASDMPGTYGESDIWMVDIDAEGDFGEPVNLGSEINTEARETFPFITDSDVLYFSSDGHPGLGGLDVFATNLDGNQGPGEIINLGEPLNSDEDDFSFIINESSKQGFFASNRPNGKGDDDIYAFTEMRPLRFGCVTISGITKNAANGDLITNSTVQLLDGGGKVLATTISDTKGNFRLYAPCSNENYEIRAAKEDYREGSVSFEHTDQTNVESLEVFLSPPNLAEKGTDLTKFLNLNPIYFDLNKSNIRSDAKIELNKVLEYMLEYPEVKIAIGSHTDSRGKDSYNFSLSDRRAKSTMAYLIENGISPDRLSAKGYGETKLLNRCSNGVRCSNAEHDVNRRSEFIVVE